MKDALGDRMKEYEGIESNRRLLPLLPAIARLDGKCFSKYTKGLKRPYDHNLSELMAQVTKYLVKETNANIGYTQSDEITLMWYSPDYKSQIFHNGRIQKMTSILAAYCSSKFNELRDLYIETKKGMMAAFDCRVWNVPNKAEAVNTFLWREIDATKNSVSMAAREHFSHKQLHKQGRADMMDMLMSIGINWNDYPPFFKRGTYIQKKHTERKYTTEELNLLPEKHEARTNPNLIVNRSFVDTVDMPPLQKITNKEEVLFDGADPVVEDKH